MSILLDYGILILSCSCCCFGFLTSLVQPGSLCSHFACIMGWIHFDFKWTDRNFLQIPPPKKNTSLRTTLYRRKCIFQTLYRAVHCIFDFSFFFYLFCEQHHDGVAAGGGRSVLDSEGVIVILDNVKVDVCLGRADHPWGALDSNADVP